MIGVAPVALLFPLVLLLPSVQPLVIWHAQASKTTTQPQSKNSVKLEGWAGSFMRSLMRGFRRNLLLGQGEVGKKGGEEEKVRKRRRSIGGGRRRCMPSSSSSSPLSKTGCWK